ncbi:ABC transporter substrate-binding protein [Nonomuraea sp. NPDC050310]|uniref:ABC transporter substrate-binding protein n=1 Tax=unclassified Nonomuraea TaxID=2593643 RepID=UPI0033F15C00
MRKTAAAAALALLAAGCGGGAGEAGPATLTIAVGADPGLLDPATAVLGATNSVLSLAYETLVRTSPDGKIIPGLAEKWEVKPDAVAFTLRQGVKCSDGSTLTPAEVAANINYLTDPANKSPLLGVLAPVGMKAAADAATVTVSTPEPFSFILESTRLLFIVCGKGLQDRSLLAKATYGTSPYELKEVAPSDHYTFAKRQGSAAELPDQVVLKVVPNEQTAANLLMSGDVNAATFFGPDRQRVQAAPGVDKQEENVSNGQYFYHQGKDRPTNDVAVRKALTQALDLAELGRVSSGGTGKPVTGLVPGVPPCIGDSVSGHVPGLDPAAASAGLDAAGWTAGADGIRAKDGKKLSLRLLYTTTRGPGVQAAAEYLAAAWKKIGVEVKLNGVIDTKLAESLNVTQDWDVVWLPIGVTLPSQLVGFLSGPAAPKGANFAHLANERYTELVAKAATTPGAEGCKLWLEAESALIANSDLVPVSTITVLNATKGAKAAQQAGLFDPYSFRVEGSN